MPDSLSTPGHLVVIDLFMNEKKCYFVVCSSGGVLTHLAPRLYGEIDGLEQVAHALEGVEQEQHPVSSAEVVYAVGYHLVRHQSVLYEVEVLNEVGELANVHHFHYGIPYVCRHV